MTQEIVAVASPVKQAASFLENSGIDEKIRPMLPPTMTPERLRFQALTMLSQPGSYLPRCSHQSIYTGIVQAAELQLELSGPLGQAYLVPRSSKGQWVATFQVGYRGLMGLAYRSGKVSNFQLRIVYKDEPFSVEYGDYPRLKHSPILDADPGEPWAYYCLVNFTDGGKDFEVMNRVQVLAHRERFASTKSGGPWYDMNHGFHEMALKTVCRRLCKRMPVSVQLVKAAMLDEYHEAGIVDHNLLPVSTTERTDQVVAALQAREAIDAPPAEDGWDAIEEADPADTAITKR
jgi:recombination protein RecT